jgi:hypothetical protein
MLKILGWLNAILFLFEYYLIMSFDFLFVLGLSSVLLLNPVKVVINFVAQTLKEVLEERSKISVVRFVFELQCSTVSAILRELFREAFAKIINLSHDLLFLDFLILFLDVSSLKVLPRETASQEVHKQVAE